MTLRADADGPAPFPPLDGLDRMMFAGATERPAGNNLVLPFDGFTVVCFGITLISLISKCLETFKHYTL
jgi:hypothetical protein